VPQILELSHLSQYYRMAEVYIGAGRVQAELDSQLPARFGRLGKFFSKLGFTLNFHCAAFQKFNLF